MLPFLDLWMFDTCQCIDTCDRDSGFNISFHVELAIQCILALLTTRQIEPICTSERTSPALVTSVLLYHWSSYYDSLLRSGKLSRSWSSASLGRCGFHLGGLLVCRQLPSDASMAPVAVTGETLATRFQADGRKIFDGYNQASLDGLHRT